MNTIRAAALGAVIAFLLAVGFLSSSSGQGTGQMLNCPQPSRWAIAVWNGPDGASPATALATCSEGVAAAYSLAPDTQAWASFFPDRPALGTLTALNSLQGVLALGAGGGAVGAWAAFQRRLPTVAKGPPPRYNAPIYQPWACARTSLKGSARFHGGQRA